MSEAFSTTDWAVVGGYAALLGATGWWFSRRKQASATDYFLAGRSMPAWAVAVSTAATAISAATFVGVPVQAYTGDLTYLAANLGAIAAILVVAFVFIPAFYRAKVTTIYGLLEQRLGPGARTASSLAFLLGRVLASGSRVYIAAIPLTILFDAGGGQGSVLNSAHLLVVIAALTAIGIVYTLIGGVRSVIWTDLIQTIVFVAAAGAAVWVLLGLIPASPAEIWREVSTARTPSGTSKATLISLSLDPSRPYTLWASIFGMGLLYLAAYGTDHDMAQRMLTCSTPAKGGQSAIAAVLMQIPIIAVFLVIGSLLWVYYQHPTLSRGGEPPETKNVFLAFIARETPDGILGLSIAGLAAAALSTLNSGLNAMGASLFSDVYKRVVPGGTPRHDVLMGRVAVVISGLAVGGFAAACVWWQEKQGQTLIDLALSVMTFAYAGLLAVFVTAIMTRRGNSTSAVAAIVVGFVVVASLQPISLDAWTRLVPGLAPTPDVPDDFRLGELRLAFPWQLAIGFGAAFMVCLAGKRPTALMCAEGES